MAADPSIGDAVTTAAYKFASLAANLTPGPVGQYFSGVAGTGVSFALRERRQMVERHLQRVNPSLQGRALRRAAQEAFDSYSRYWLESFRLPHLPAHVVDAGFTADGYEHVVHALDRGNGVILALPHLGGWEWAGRWMTDRGHRLTVVVEDLDNRELFEWFKRLRSNLGMTVVPVGPEAATASARALKNNEVLCLLCDRDIQGGGIEVDFFGEVTTLPGGPAMLSLRTGAPILPTGVYFESRYNGHHAIVRPAVSAERTGALRGLP